MWRRWGQLQITRTKKGLISTQAAIQLRNFAGALEIGPAQGDHCEAKRTGMRSKLFTLIGITIGSAVVAVLLIDTDWEVQHQVLIEADTATVWSVLVDIERYPQWNHYSPQVTGRIEEGATVWVEANLGTEVRRVKNKVLSVQPEKELCWQSGGWYALMARGTRCRRLSQTAGGDTLLVHHEVMSGPLAWLIARLYRDRIEKGIILVDESAAARAKALTREHREGK